MATIRSETVLRLFASEYHAGSFPLFHSSNIFKLPRKKCNFVFVMTMATLRSETPGLRDVTTEKSKTSWSLVHMKCYQLLLYKKVVRFIQGAERVGL